MSSKTSDKQATREPSRTRTANGRTDSADSATSPTGHPRADLPLQVVDHRVQRQTGRKRGLRWLFLLCLLAAGLGTLGYVFRDQLPLEFLKPAPPTVPVATSSSPVAYALGRLEPEGEVISVAAPSGAGDARVQSLNVKEGDEVEQDAILAVLDNEARLQAAVRVAIDQVEQARVQIEQTELEVRTLRLQLQAALQAAQSRLKNAQTRFTRIQKLYQANASTQEAFESRETELTTSQDAVREAEAKLSRYDAGGDAELVDVSLSRANLAIAEASLQQAQANLEQAYVRAPLMGRILRIDVREGERISQTPLLEMGATDKMLARVEVYESDIPLLRIGQRARLSAAPLAVPLQGVIERISPLVQKQTIVDATPAANTDARIIEVWVRLDPESSTIAAQFVNLQVRVEFLPSP